MKTLRLKILCLCMAFGAISFINPNKLWCGASPALDSNPSSLPMSGCFCSGTQAFTYLLNSATPTVQSVVYDLGAPSLGVFLEITMTGSAGLVNFFWGETPSAMVNMGNISRPWTHPIGKLGRYLMLQIASAYSPAAGGAFANTPTVSAWAEPITMTTGGMGASN